MAPSAIEWIEAHCANLQIQVVSTLCPEGRDCGCGLIARAEKGQIDADLGGDVIKQRIARPGQGKSKGYRNIILFRRGTFSGGTRAFLVYGFAKSQRANIDDDEEEQFKEAAKHVLALTEKQLAELLERGDFMEVKSE